MNIILIQPADKELHEANNFTPPFWILSVIYPKLLILGEKLDLIREELILKDSRKQHHHPFKPSGMDP